MAKARMSVGFEQSLVKPGDAGYVHDKRVDFAPAAESTDWDDVDALDELSETEVAVTGGNLTAATTAAAAAAAGGTTDASAAAAAEEDDYEDSFEVEEIDEEVLEESLSM
eukprot:17916-Heterococcus_DN1.PRE.2